MRVSGCKNCGKLSEKNRDCYLISRRKIVISNVFKIIQNSKKICIIEIMETIIESYYVISTQNCNKKMNIYSTCR